MPADRVVVGGLDRTDAYAAGWPLEVARRGAFVALDHVGWEDSDHLGDAERVALVAELVEAGHGNRVLLSTGATGVSKGEPADARTPDLPFSHLLASFVPLLKAHGVGDDDVQRILVDNPRELLAVATNARASQTVPTPPGR